MTVASIMTVFAVGFIRVSTGSQDVESQKRDILNWAEAHGVTIVRWFELSGYSASKGTQEPALREVIAGMMRGDWSQMIVVDSSRVDRREDLDAQAEVLMSIRRAGGEVISIAEPQYGKTDFVGRIITLVAQEKNAEKSRTVKDSTFSKMLTLQENRAHHGALPHYWKTRGVKYSRQAYCANPEAVADIFHMIADGKSMGEVGRKYNLYPKSIKAIIRFAPAHTGVIECSYTHDIHGRIAWQHKVTPVVDSALWWRANKALDNTRKGNKGGRPVARVSQWLSGVLSCPGCGGFLYINRGLTPAGNQRLNPKMRCGGHGKDRRACGKFKGTPAEPLMEVVEALFSDDMTPVLAYQRISGNQHELDALQGRYAQIMAEPTPMDRQERRERMALIDELEDQIDGFIVTPDRFDYTETGRTVAEVWAEADTAGKRALVRAIRDRWGMSLIPDGNGWAVRIGPVTDAPEAGNGAVVDLGGGLCFRRPVALAA